VLPKKSEVNGVVLHAKRVKRRERRRMRWEVIGDPCSLGGVESQGCEHDVGGSVEYRHETVPLGGREDGGLKAQSASSTVMEGSEDSSDQDVVGLSAVLGRPPLER